jgi:hypothetical protein
MDPIMFALSAAACVWLTFDATEEEAALFISYIDTYVIYDLEGDVPGFIQPEIEAEAYMYATAPHASHGVAEPVRRTTRREAASRKMLVRSRRRESANKFTILSEHGREGNTTPDRRGHRVTGIINSEYGVYKPIDKYHEVSDHDSGAEIDFPNFDVEDYITYRMEYCN